MGVFLDELELEQMFDKYDPNRNGLDEVQSIE
jgi:hypothetical protein